MPPQQNFGFLTFSDRFWCNLEVIAIAIPSGFISIGRLKRRKCEPVRDVRGNDGAQSAIATHTHAAELKPKKPTPESATGK